MAEVGELSWVAEIQGLASAKRDAESVSDGVSSLAEDSRAADEAVGDVGGTASDVSGSFEGLGSATQLLGGLFSLLGASVLQLVFNLTTLTGVLGVVRGLFVSLIGAKALGGLLVVGKAVVAILGVIATALGLPVVAVAALVAAIIGIVATIWLFHDEIWNAITGVIDFFADLGSSAVDSIVGMGNDIWNAAVSLSSDLIGWGSDLVDSIVGFFSDIGSDALEEVTDFTSDVKDGFDDLVSDVTETVKGFGESLAGFITDGIKGVWNTVIPDEVGFPEVELPSTTIDAGPLGEHTIGGQTVFEGFSFSLPQLQTGGFIESGGAVEVHDDELVLPADVSRDVMDAIDGGGGGGGEERVSLRIDQLLIEIGDQMLDVRELDRAALETLAELIGDQMGDQLKQLV